MVGLDLSQYTGKMKKESLGRFSRSFQSPSECYKFYWLEALVQLLKENPDTCSFTYDQIITRMISNAWYTVSFYHIHLGPGRIDNQYSDNVESAVMALNAAYVKDYGAEIPYNTSIEQLDNIIHQYDSALRKQKVNLTYNVPYRFLSPFLDNVSKEQWNRPRIMCDIIRRKNQDELLPYTITPAEKKPMEWIVTVAQEWRDFLTAQYTIIVDWIKYNKVLFLQSRNPGVPGIIDKLEPYRERKLTNVKGLWKYALSMDDFHDIYSGKSLTSEKYDIDHFVPWSYVANDELWNLIPAASSLNIQKSNHLPDWSTYGKEFLDSQYRLYQDIHSSETAEKLYRKCLKDNLNADWARRLYDRADVGREEFINELEPNVHTQYKSAQQQGFRKGRFVFAETGASFIVL